MSDLRKQKLIELGVEKIADILLDFSCRYDEIDDCVNWLVAPPDKKLSLVKSKISRLRKFDDFIDWRHASGFERGVENILDDIKSLNPDPETGLSLTADFSVPTGPSSMDVTATPSAMYILSPPSSLRNSPVIAMTKRW